MLRFLSVQPQFFIFSSLSWQLPTRCNLRTDPNVEICVVGLAVLTQNAKLHCLKLFCLVELTTPSTVSHASVSKSSGLMPLKNQVAGHFVNVFCLDVPHGKVHLELIEQSPLNESVVRVSGQPELLGDHLLHQMDALTVDSHEKTSRASLQGTSTCSLNLARAIRHNQEEFPAEGHPLRKDQVSAHGDVDWEDFETLITPTGVGSCENRGQPRLAQADLFGQEPLVVVKLQGAPYTNTLPPGVYSPQTNTTAKDNLGAILLGRKQGVRRKFLRSQPLMPSLGLVLGLHASKNRRAEKNVHSTEGALPASANSTRLPTIYSWLWGQHLVLKCVSTFP